jgi:hypothetical protein
MSYQPCEDGRTMISKILRLLAASLRALRPRSRSASGFVSQLEFHFRP